MIATPANAWWTLSERISAQIGFAKRVADRVIMMDEGEIIEDGAPDEFFASPGHERTRRFLEAVN